MSKLEVSKPAEEVVREMIRMAEAAGYSVDHIAMRSIIKSDAGGIFGSVRYEFDKAA